MTVQLGGIDLDPNLILQGEYDTPQTIHSVRSTLGGVNVIQIETANFGSELRLIATDGSPRQGKFCGSHLVALQQLANLAQEVQLNYNGAVYDVYILGIKVREWYGWEPPSDTKKYSGTIYLQES